MSKITVRKKKILASSIVFLSILIALFSYNWIQYQQRLQFPSGVCENESWCLKIHGNVKEEAYIGISTLLDGETFVSVENQEFDMLNSWETEYHRTVSGVALDDILEKIDNLDPEATRIQFVAIDGFKSFELPIRIILNNPSAVLIVTHQNGALIEDKDDGGDGSLMAMVTLDAILGDDEMVDIFADKDQDIVYNSVYNVKYLSEIKVI